MKNTPEPVEDDPAAAFDDEGGLTWMNGAMRRLLGYRPDEDLSSTIVSDFYEESEYERILQEAYPHAAQNGCWFDRVVMRTKDGRSIETRHRIEARLDASGKIEGLIFCVEIG